VRPPIGAAGLVTNPPFQLAQRFAAKAIAELDYVALLVRTNFLTERTVRGHWLDAHPPSRQWLSSQRLPMMHRHGWQGPRSSSNTPHAWAIRQRAPRGNSHSASIGASCSGMAAAGIDFAHRDCRGPAVEVDKRADEPEIKPLRVY
jgi:hypothetical protein